MERTDRSWKEPSEVDKNREKLESFKWESLMLESFAEVGKSLAKLERTQRSWKEPSEVGKNRVKLERTERSWNASFEVGKFWLRLASLNELGKL